MCTAAPGPLPDSITAISVYVEGADGLQGRPYMPDHAIDVLTEIAWERQRQTDVCGHTRAADDRLVVGDFTDLVVDRAEAACQASQHHDKAGARRLMLQVAATAMAAVEMLDRWLGDARPDDPVEASAVQAGAAPQGDAHG